MKALKGIVPREVANRDVQEAIDHYLIEASAKVAMGFVDELEKAYAHIARQPATANISLLSTTANAVPNLVKTYCNASRTLPGAQFEPGTPFQPAFNISVAATLDESGNFVDLHFGPLSIMDQATGTSVNGNYHLASASGSAYNQGSNSGAPKFDYDGESRPATTANPVDIGADEYVPGAPIATVNPSTVAFGNQLVNTTSAAQTVTLTNNGTAPLTVTGVALNGNNVGQFAIASNGCTAPLGVGATCSVTVTFLPTSTGGKTTQLRFTDNATGSPQAVTLTGTGVGPAVTSIAPAFGARGSVTAVTIKGTNLLGGAVTVSGSRVTVGNVVVFDANTITATLAPAPNAQTGNRTVTVTTTSGTATATFAVN